ncbi:hypothetical protein KP509_39G059700 [Ceratopteris richardii]|uniref:Small-subunit processome Utp12 domain-containing protein n=1 Tax=Ceratopteris richardii TaxID=49495 RepID=A0A8T2Q1I0_CERRI|nr:hypothetical protein KP509_39G059700 [Ceratopteris richardii]KAH7277625.1 hypothetical protein KP509_39G059700 [Ceratopteris richardii]
MNFKFHNLLGAPYRGGNVLLSGNTQLISPVGNRISITDLIKSESQTLPCENGKDVHRIAISPNGALLLSIDKDGKSLLINVRQQVVLHRFSFKGPVSALQFSPDGTLIAAAVGKLLQIWRTPGFKAEFSPFQHVRSFASCHDTITCVDWSPDSQWLIVGSKDLSARLFCIHNIEKYSPVVLMGHKDVIHGVYFQVKAHHTSENRVIGAYSVSRDGAVFSWKHHALGNEQDYIALESSNSITVKAQDSRPYAENGTELDERVGYLDLLEVPSTSVFQDNGKRKLEPKITEDSLLSDGQSDLEQVRDKVKRKKIGTRVFRLDGGRWELTNKHFFMQSSKLTSCDYHQGLNMLVAGFAHGIFGIYQMPDFTCIHLLSISKQKLTTSVFNGTGNWIAFGCAKLGQLLVWEWRSESYILKQQGHYFDVNAVDYSPDSQLIATGADDNKLKVWNASSGFCFVTFAEHTNSITAVHFLPSNNALLSASLDGTVRAWDLLRYRNFRTFTTPRPTQFASLATDKSGEVVCAGSLDSFQIYVWSMKTSRLLDVLSGHEGPVHGLIFSPVHEMLASSSWDKTVRIWDVFDGKGGTEVFSHTHDVLTVAYRPDGRQLASTTLDGKIHLWDPIEGELTGTIEGRRDIAGGRLMIDRMTAANSSSGKCFTTICYSADGIYLLAGGNSKYICMYDLSERVLLRRFQITHNRSIDGVLDFLNSKHMTDAGPIDLIDDNDSDAEEGQERTNLGFGLPGTLANAGKPSARTRCIKISPTGRSWVAATTEGVLVYSIDDTILFDPTDLDVDVTPEAIESALESGKSTLALVLALRLNEPKYIRKTIEAVPVSDLPLVASQVPVRHLNRLFESIADIIGNSPYLEFLLIWCQELCRVHGRTIQTQNQKFLPALRALQKAITGIHEDLAGFCNSNNYLLDYFCSAPNAKSFSLETASLGQRALQL